MGLLCDTSSHSKKLAIELTLCAPRRPSCCGFCPGRVQEERSLVSASVSSQDSPTIESLTIAASGCHVSRAPEAELTKSLGNLSGNISEGRGSCLQRWEWRPGAT